MRAKKHDEYPFYRLEERPSMKVPEALVDLARCRCPVASRLPERD